LQVADRFHLMLNLSAAIERVLEERSRELLLPAVAEPSVPTPASPPPVAKLSVAQERKQQRRQRRLDRYEQAAELHKRGVSKPNGVDRSIPFSINPFQSGGPRRRASTADYRFNSLMEEHKGSFVLGYNAQAAVHSQTHVIVAAEITQQANDSQQLVPMIQQVVANVGSKPSAVSADAGYWSART